MRTNQSFAHIHKNENANINILKTTMTTSIKAKLDNIKIKTIIDKHRGAKLFILIRNLNKIFELLNLEYFISTTCQYLNLIK